MKETKWSCKKSNQRKMNKIKKCAKKEKNEFYDVVCRVAYVVWAWCKYMWRMSIMWKFYIFFSCEKH